MRIAGCHGALVTCALVLLATACADGDRGAGRVLLVGIDGASLRVARPLIHAGKLPNLAGIASRGVYGPLQSHPPMMSPRIWTSIATGKMPNAHGIRGFATEDAEGRQRLYLSSDRKAVALWNIASEAGRRVAVVNWWSTYPVEHVDGVVVSDHVVAHEVSARREIAAAPDSDSGPTVYPDEWRQRVADLARAEGALTDVANPFADAGGFPHWVETEQLAERFRDDEWITRIALAIEREIHPDLQMVFLPGIDRVSHRLWGAIEPASRYPEPYFSDAERAVSAAALRRYYEFTDALVGLLAAAYGPDDLVLVVSDHGFEAGTGMGFLTGVHETVASLNGVIFAAGPRIRAAPGRVSVNDITPTILAWWGLPVARDMDGRPAPFLDVSQRPVVRVDSYDGTAVERQPDRPSGAEESMLEELRALGYLEGPEDP